MLAAAGVPVEQRPAAIDESELKDALRADGAAPGDAALALAELKARRIAGQAPESLVLGADQILTCEGEWFDKPRDLAEARAPAGNARRPAARAVDRGDRAARRRSHLA